MAGTVVIGAEQLMARLAADSAKMDSLKPFFLEDSAHIIKERIQESITQQGLIDTGKLHDSVRVFGQTKNTIKIGAGKDLEYAEPLELGSIQHEITGNPLLSFLWGESRSGGYYGFHSSGGNPSGTEGWFVGPRVMHPGNIAYRYVYHGTFFAFPEVAMAAQQYLREIFGGSL